MRKRDFFCGLDHRSLVFMEPKRIMAKSGVKSPLLAINRFLRCQLGVYQSEIFEFSFNYIYIDCRIVIFIIDID